MSYVLRTWACQNSHCAHTFTAGSNYPACPRCKCVRVTWVPGGGHTAKIAPNADRELRTLADLHGLTNLRSAREGEAAKITATPPAGANAGTVNFQGFAATIDPASHVSSTNRSGAQCVPTTNHVDFKVKPSLGGKFTGQLGLPPLPTRRAR